MKNGYEWCFFGRIYENFIYRPYLYVLMQARGVYVGVRKNDEKQYIKLFFEKSMF